MHAVVTSVPVEADAEISPLSGSPATGFARGEKKAERIRRQGGDNVSRTGDEAVVEAPPQEVSPENRQFIGKVLQKHFLFAGLEDHERSSLCDYMMMQRCKPNEVVFLQGQKGDCCYIIQSGVFTVSIDNQNVKQLRSKHTFGELAMLYHVNRTASVTCTQEGMIWKMDGRSFAQCMVNLSEKHEKRAMVFLNADPNFTSMSGDQKKLLAGACSVQNFARGEQILREGEVGDWMFIVIDGNVQTVDRFGNSAQKKPGTILGSAGLMYGRQQVAGAKAIDSVTCLALGKSMLERLIGPVEDVLRGSAIKALLVDNAANGSELNFFKELTDVQQNQVISQFEEGIYEAADAVVSPGSRAQLVVVIEGEVAVVEAQAIEAAGGNVAILRDAAREVLTSGMTCGGLALLNNSEMKAGIVALSHTRIHHVGHAMIQDVLGEPLLEVIRKNEIKKVLGDIFLFKNLTEGQIDLTVRSLERQQYDKDDIIVKQGDEAEKFYLIQSGTICVSKDGSRIRSLGRWDYFGERGLLLRDRRSASCFAEEPCSLFMLDKKVFADIVGIFRKELEHRMSLQDLDMTMPDLRLRAIVGRGSFGIVKLVFHASDENRVYALKCVAKKQVVRQGQQKSMCIEREINAQCYHPCLMQFIKTFQDSKNVYFLTEFLGGGDLFYAIREIGNLVKSQAQFYGGSIALALEYLHARMILYRDLKPENVLLDMRGNAKLVDFGCCKIALRTNTLVGTPEYFAPETILGKGYTCAIDWWALGVMMHEFVVGPLPFGRETEDQLELFREILEAPLQFPNYITDDTAISLVNGMLERTPELRLGASKQGCKEIKDHSYYAKFDWDALVARTMKAPWQPNQKKLQANWEACAGEVVEEGDTFIAGSKMEPGMEWAESF